MRKFFLFVLPAVLFTAVTQANSALWSTAFPAADFDSTHSSPQLSVIAPEKVCEASELRLQPSIFEPANTYTWITPAGKQINGVELIIKHSAVSDAGTYRLKVTGTQGEHIVATQVKVVPRPSATINGSLSACEGSVFGLSASSAQVNQFEWILPNGNSITAPQLNIQKLKLSDAGAYQLNVSANGCSNTIEFNVVVKQLPSTSFTGDVVVCESSPIILKTNADSSVKYTWWKGQNAIQNNSVFTIAKAGNNHAGQYLLQAKLNGCINSMYFNIEVKPSFTIGAVAKNELCAGENLSLKAVDAGTGAVYNWSGPDFNSSQKDPTIEKVSEKNSGVYTLRVTKGCSMTATVNVSVKEKPAARIIGSTAICENSRLQLTAEKEGKYFWTLPNGSQQSGSVLTIEKISKSDEGDYKLVSPAGVCSDSATVFVKVNTAPRAIIKGGKEVCEGEVLQFAAENTPSDTKWVFANQETYSGAQISVRALTGHSGLLKLTVGKGECISSDSVMVFVKQTPVINISGPFEVCRFAPSYSLQIKEANGLKGLGFFTGDIITKGGEVSTAKEGVYPIRYSFAAKNGCSTVKTETIRIKKSIEVNAGADIIRKGDESVQINAIASDNYNKIEWTNISPSEGNSLHPIVKPDFTTTYKVTVTNAVGCSASDEVTVKVMKIKLANAFSPNGDGINDQFTFEGLREYPNAQIQIFSGAGKLVFSAKGSSAAWDGRCNGIPVEAGTYYYNIILNDGKQNAPVQGWIQLKR